MEESSRFGQATFGSRAYAGRIAAAEAAGWRDREGRALADCFAENGLDLAALGGARCDPAPYAYLELHIEQGIILREAGASVGVVTGIAAPLRVLLTVIGEAGHSGAALPEQRKDALMAAGRILSRVEDLVARERPWGTVATIGFFRVSPNVMNVVPGEVEMSVDVRGVDTGSRQRLARAILRAAAEVASRRGLEVRLSVIGEEAPAVIPPAMIEVIEAAAREEGIAHQRIVSLAGHDAMQVAAVAPAGMILIRNASGTSHSPKEQVAPEDVEAGCRVLHRAARALLDPERFLGHEAPAGPARGRQGDATRRGRARPPGGGVPDGRTGDDDAHERPGRQAGAASHRAPDL